MSAKTISIEFDSLSDEALEKLRQFVKCMKNENYSELEEMTELDKEDFDEHIDSGCVELDEEAVPIKLILDNLSVYFQDDALKAFLKSIGVEKYEVAVYHGGVGEYYFYNQDGDSDREIEYPEFEDEFVVVTGKIGDMSREEFESLIEDLGGVPQRNVTSKTTLIFIGDKPGKSKLDKARELGVREMHIDDCRDDIRFWNIDDW